MVETDALALPAAGAAAADSKPLSTISHAPPSLLPLPPPLIPPPPPLLPSSPPLPHSSISIFNFNFNFKLYADSSVLERHHVHLTLQLLARPECAITRGMDASDRKKLRKVSCSRSVPCVTLEPKLRKVSPGSRRL
jgi:hypothetical protein